MKKIFAVLLACVLFVAGIVTAFALEIDYSSLTDAELDEAILDIEDPRENIALDLSETYMEEEVENQLKVLDSAPGKMLYAEWLTKQQEIDKAALRKILQTKEGRKAYAEKYHIPLESMEEDLQFKIPDEIFTNFNRSDEEIAKMEVDHGNLFEMFSKMSSSMR